jgi:hypothetical protein
MAVAIAIDAIRMCPSAPFPAGRIETLRFGVFGEPAGRLCAGVMAKLARSLWLDRQAQYR